MPEETFAAQYARMSLSALMKFGRTYDDLIEPAQAALREEFQRRQLEPPLIEESQSQKWQYRNLVTVAKFSTLTEGLAARAALESLGIECFLQDENFVRIDWFYTNFIGGLRLQVAMEDAEDAKAILDQPMPSIIPVEGQPDFIQPVCPQCGSGNVALGFASGKMTGQDSLPPSAEVWRCSQCKCVWMDDGSDPVSAASA